MQEKVTVVNEDTDKIISLLNIYVHISRLTIVSCEAKKKQAVCDK